MNTSNLRSTQLLLIFILRLILERKLANKRAEFAFNMAECYRFTGQCKRAASYYLRAEKLGYGSKANLGYAEMLQCQGEYEDAIVAFEGKKLTPTDTRADNGITCRQASQWKKRLFIFI